MRMSVGLSAAALSLAIAGTAIAAYPERPITFIIGAAAGGTADIRVRSYIPYFEKCLGRPVIPVNRSVQPAAWAEVASAAPDGYTISTLSHPNFALALLLASDIKYKFESFEWLGNLFQNYTNIAVRKDSPIKDIDQFTDKLKAKADLKIGISRLTSDDVLLLLKLKKILNVEIVPIPLGDTAKTMTALLGGHIDAIVSSAEGVQTRKEEIRALAVATDKRIVSLTDVPTFAEKNMPIFSDLLSPIAAPAGLPADVRSKLSGCLGTVAKDPTFVEESLKRGAIVNYMDSEKLTDYLKKDFLEIKALVDANKALLGANP